MPLSSRFLSLLLALFPAIAPAAIVSSEIAVSDPVLQAAPGSQSTPLIASDGRDFLAVWLDERLSYSIYARRLSRDGDVLDPLGIRLPVSIGGIKDLLWTGSNYLLLSERTDLVRVGRDGRVLGTPTRLAAEATTIGSAASNGTVTLVGYRVTEAAGAPSVRAAVLDRDGAVIRTLELPAEGRLFEAPLFAWNGESFIAVWTTWGPRNETRVDAIRISADGSLLEETAVPLTTGYVQNIASDGAGFAILIRGPARQGLVHVSGDLRIVSDVDRMDIPNGAESALAWNGSEYIVTWADYRGMLRAVTVDGQRTLRSFDIAEASTGRNVRVDVAANGDSAFVVWDDIGLLGDVFNRYTSDVFLAAITNAVPGPRMLVSVSAAQQSWPSIASDGVGAVAVWLESSGVYLSRISADGTYLDGRGLRLSDSVNALAPVVTFDGHAYIVAWTELASGLASSTRIRTAVVRSDGSITSGQDILGAVGGALAGGDHQSLLVFHDPDGSIAAARLDTNARVVGEAVVIARHWDRYRGSRYGYPSVGWNGTRWLVAWSEAADLLPQAFPGSPVYARARLRATLVNSDGRLATGLWTIADEAQTHHTSAAISSNGDAFAIVWQKSRDDAPVEIEGAILSNALIMRERFVLGEGRLPSIAWSGSRYFAAWSSNDDIVGTEIGVDGTMEAAPFAIAASADAEKNASLADMRGGVIAAYVRVAEEPKFGGVERVFARSVFEGTSLRRRVVLR